MADTEEYKAKLKALKKYIPFLKNMMVDLQTKGNREAQLTKIQSLYDMITDDRKKLKLETLNRCEEVLTNIYIKVNPQIKNKTILAPASPTQPIEVPDSPPRDVDETPRSPSPERSDDFILTSKPVTIPTEKVLDIEFHGSSYGISRPSNIPKIDIYGAAAFDILYDKKKEPPPEVVKIPDISKPPITLDDLRNLEDDVQDRITAVHLTTKPIAELEQYKKDLELQLRVEDINRTMSSKSSSEINTTVRNKLDLSHIKKSKEAKSSSSKNSSKEYDNKKVRSRIHKVEKEPKAIILESKIIKPPDLSIFDILLLNKNNKEKERSSKEEKHKKNEEKDGDKKKRDSSKDKSKKSERTDNVKNKTDKKREESKDRREPSKDRKKDHKIDSAKRESDKKKLILNRDGASNDLKSRLFSSDLLKTSEGSQSSIESASPNEAKKPQNISNKEPRKSFEEQLIAPETQKPFKRLADKYNPKPKKPSPDDFDKLVSKSIEKSMKISPAKVPSIFDKLSESINTEDPSRFQTKMPEPDPPPASLVKLTMDNPSPEPENPKTVQLPEILQKIFQNANKPPVETPKIADPRLEQTKPRNLPADPRRRNEVKPPPLLSRDPPFVEVGPPLLSPNQRQIPSLLSPSHPMGALTPSPGLLPLPHSKALLPNPNQSMMYQNPNLTYPSISSGIDFVPPSPLVDFTSPSPRVDFMDITPSPNFEQQPRFIPPDFLENPVRPPFQNVNFLNREHLPNEKVTQPLFGGQSTHLDHGNQYDRHRLAHYDLHNQSMNFYQVNNYNGMPMLQPEVPHYLPEQKPYLPDPTPHYPSWNDNMRSRWRDDRRSGDYRSYKEHRELREREERERREREDRERREREDKEQRERESNIRDPRIAKDSQEKTDVTRRDSRSRDRDTRREERHSRSKSRSRREESKERPQKDSEKEKPFEKSRFDKMYSTTNRDRSRSRSKSSSEEEVFTSPLDSLYGPKEDKITGRGYGMQSFRIPKKRKEERIPKPKESKTIEKENKSKKPPRKIQSDEEDNILDDLSDRGGASDNEVVSDQEVIEESIFDTVKAAPTKATEKDRIQKKERQKSDRDEVIAIKDENIEQNKKQESKKIALKKKEMAEKEVVIKIEESESEEIIEIKDEIYEERHKSLRKRKPIKPVPQTPSPSKRQPARKVKKTSVPQPIIVKEETDDDIEEIPAEFEVIDVDDDEETQREIEEIEAIQIAESTKQVEENSRTQRATSEEMDAFVSEYVLEVSGDVNKCFTPMEINIKQEIIYETVEETSSLKTIDAKAETTKQTTGKSNKPRKTSSIEEEAVKRIALINKLAKSNEIVLNRPVQLKAPEESEADVAANELSELLEASKDLVSVEKDFEPISKDSDQPNAEANELSQNNDTNLQPEIDLPSVKASEIVVQEPTSSQDEQKPVEDSTSEKAIENRASEVSEAVIGEVVEPAPSKNEPEPETSKKNEESAEPSEPNILAHFFENLLKSKNKKDKKTALFSLIQTFSDSFTDRELNKITKIITADQEDENSDNESTKSKDKPIDKEETIVEPKESLEEEAPIVGSTTEEEVVPVKAKRIRRLSSTTEEDNQCCDTSQEQHPKKDDLEPVETILAPQLEEPVLVSVGERIKNRRRNPAALKPKKHKTELDRIHEDIKEMFIRDGVLTATGKRMTRMLKEDPNALSPTKSINASPETGKTLRKKPASKSKNKESSNNMKDVRVLLSKIPENKFKSQNTRVLRSNRRTSIIENDGITESNFADESGKSDSESETSDLSESEEEKDDDDGKKSQSVDTTQPKQKSNKRRPKSAWALGIIKKSRKKPSTVKSKENSPERTASPEIDNNASLEEDLDKLFVEPDKNYYHDPTDKKKLHCKLCDFSGIFITTHYLKEHPHSEVLCSRLSPEMAKDAQKDYQAKVNRYDAIVNKRLALKYSYSCRFCGYTSQTAPIFFYEHLTTHTGEYRHQCGICHFYSVTGKTLNQHFLNAHPGEEKNAVRETYTKAIIYGYLCGECNYVQLKEKAVEEHVNIYHLGDKPKIYKISMSKILDPALEDTKTNLIVKPQTAPAASRLDDIIASVSTSTDLESKKSNKTASDSASTAVITNPKKKIKKVTRKSNEAVESMPESDVIPPKMRRKPGPKSKTRPHEISVIPSEGTSEAESGKEDQQIIVAPPVRRRPGPKSKTRKQPIAPSETSESENVAEPETTDSEMIKEQTESSASEEPNTGSKPAKISKKRRSLEALICKENGEDLDSVIALSSRSSRAAKEKASAHIKLFIESNEGSPRKLKALANEQNKMRKSSSSSETKNDEQNSGKAKDPEKDGDTSQLPTTDDSDKLKKTDSNVFTCESDILQEERTIEQERLKKMEELNKSLNTRSSKLDFVEKLSNRLTNEDTSSATAQIQIKEEPKDAEMFERPETPMPVLEKEAPISTVRSAPLLAVSSSPKPVMPSEIPSESHSPAAKKPNLEGATPIPSVNVNLRSNSLFPDIIEKLQGKVGPPQTPTASDSDSSEPVQFIEIGRLLRATRQTNAIIFSCHAANCYVSTKDRMVFQLHCKFGHRDIPVGESCLCNKCGVNITTTPDTTLMENLYDHLMYAHSDFIDASSKPRMLKMRRLSGDKLSIKKEDELDSIKKENEDEEVSKKPEDTPLPMETTDTIEQTTSVVSQASLELAADNPFTFKIAEVMSLASESSPKSQAVPKAVPTQMSPQKQNIPPKPSPAPQVVRNSPSQISQPPPLTLINPKPQTQAQLVIKEAKLTQAELNKPRKAPKAMTKFIETPGDLYKCPHYYCLFTTNFRAFLERHLKAHKSDTEVMIPCVYCDIKTPWEHVPMHIDIRHAHCRFACSYCLYRSWMQEYVCLHQNNHHPGMEYSVIQVPQHKAAKKFSVADLKTDPKLLCEPFRCICGDNVKEYLYENEFDQHLNTHDHRAFFQCGYKGCSMRIQPHQMITHWASFHGICTYQCGYCKMSNKDIVKMYYHFAQFHQWMGPDILVRIGDYILDIKNELGYSAEAFEKLAHITNLPSNVVFTLGKPKGPKKIKIIHLTNTTSQSPVTPTDTTVDSSNLTSNIVKPTTSVLKTPVTSLINASNQNIQLIVTTSSTAPSNLVLLPATTTVATSDTTLTATQSNVVKSPVKIVSLTNPPELATLSTVKAITLSPRSISTELATLKSSNVNTSPPKQNENAVASLPPGISWTKVTDANKKDFVDDKTQEKPADIIKDTASKSIEPNTPSPILLPEPDENSFDEPLFDNIDVNSDSPVVDPLSIEPTIAGIPNEDPIGTSEDAMGIPEDPLSLPLQEAPESEVEKSVKIPKVNRSVSNITNSDEETSQDKTGLQGYQLYRCAICSISFSNTIDFRQHINHSVRCRKEGTRPYKCVHCNKLVKSSVKLLQHIQIHGILRYSCSLCSMKFAVSYLAKMHMKTRHQISQSKMIPVVPGKINTDVDSFIMRPVLALQPPTTSKESKDSSGESPSKSGGEEMTFTPDNVKDIPIRQIFTQHAKCGLCNYQTKVRVNIVRHLQMHSDDKWVPDTAPVNPVPCLDRNEKMFDKMINLAASSMDGRMGGGKSDKEEERIPDYVPSYCRFVCCAQGCTYLCLEESNLRHHIMALHSDELEFSCGHCKIKIEPPDVESVIKHLKLHGLHLYKCKYCVFVHNLKHRVERHISDTHVDSPVKVVTVRQMDTEQDNDRSVEPVKDTNVNKTRPWKCCFCKYTTTTEDLIRNHIATKHNLDCQFKCALCSYKSNEKDTFDDHFKEKHSSNELDIIYVYQYVEEQIPKEDDGHNDTTPLWQRDKPRVRHIRGILLDESGPEPTKSPKSKSTTKTAFSTAKSGPSKNLFDSIDAVARGDVFESIKTYGKSNPEPKKAIAPKLANIVEDKTIKIFTENDPLKITTKETTTKTKTTSQNVLSVASKSILIENEDGPPPLKSLQGDYDFKEILPTIKELTKVKQGSNDPIIIIDDDDDEEPVSTEIMKPQTENRGKKRAGTTDLLQEALKMAKLDDFDRTDLDDNGTPISEYSEEKLKKIYGDFGSPNNRQWKCPLCLQFRSKRISDFIFHIYKDLNIFRYRCKTCKDESITFKYMIGHIKTHFQPMTEDDIEVLPPKYDLEAWIQMVLREQSITITNNIQNLSKPVALVDENISCMFCNLRFPNAAEASEHMLKHWITKPYLCMYCPSDFYTRYELRHHQATTHPNLKQVLNNVSPTVSEAMHRFDDGFRKRPLAPTKQDFAVAPKRMKFSQESSDTINIVSVNDILNKAKEVPSTSVVQKIDDNNTINIDSDEDLVVVTKTDEFVPNEDDVYACAMCEYVTDKEQNVLRHLEGSHGSKSLSKFKILSKKDSETSKDFLACNVCHVVLSELKLRLHFIENHQTKCHYSPYIFTCNLCFARFTLLRSIKQHFTSKHQGSKVNFSTIEGGSSIKGTIEKQTKMRYYQCVFCEFTSEALSPNPMRTHVKSVHFKSVECDVCHERLRSESDAITHHRKTHDIGTQPRYRTLEDIYRKYLETMRLIMKMSTPVKKISQVAKKSTSSPQQKKTESPWITLDVEAMQNLTDVALRSICDSDDKFEVSRTRTTVVIDGTEKNMTVEELSDIFPLQTYVDLSESLVVTDGDSYVK